MSEGYPLQLKDTILKELRTGIFSQVFVLPKEQDMAERLGVSRTLLRETLLSLEGHGYISRKRGVGTVVNRRVLDIKTRMDVKENFRTIIEYADKVPSIRVTITEEILADKDKSERLHVPEGSKLLKIIKVFYADEDPAILVENYFSLDMIKQKDISDHDFSTSIFEFLKNYCSEDAHLSICRINAVAADDHVSELLKCPKNSPVVFLSGIYYNFYGQPLIIADEHYAEGIFNYEIVRKQI